MWVGFMMIKGGMCVLGLAVVLSFIMAVTASREKRKIQKKMAEKY